MVKTISLEDFFLQAKTVDWCGSVIYTLCHNTHLKMDTLLHSIAIVGTLSVHISGVLSHFGCTNYLGLLKLHMIEGPRGL